MIRKILAALLVGAAVVALNRPDEAREAIGGAAEELTGRAGELTGRAGEALVGRCRADPEACLR